MSTKHTFTHADGSVSKRTSANRVYPFAVESVRNQYGYAKDLEQHELVRAEETLAAFQGCAANDEWEVTTKPYGSFDSHTLHLVGYGYVTSWYTNHTNGKPDDEEPNRQAELVRVHANLVQRVEFEAKRVADLLAGPEFSYGIVTWSSRRDLAQKEASRLQGRSSWYCGYSVVETTYVTKEK